MKAYLEMIASLLSENKTTGEDHSEAMLHFTRMNLKRMNRWMKTGEINPETKEVIIQIEEPQTWVLLTEAWCGDAAHIVPFISKMAALNENVTLEIKLRDENLGLMDRYLTNGGRSIPKLIAFDVNGQELFNWGPRPKAIQDEFLKLKNAGLPSEEVKIALQRLYNQDKGAQVQMEVRTAIENCISCTA